jgi:hypothetical protein
MLPSSTPALVARAQQPLLSHRQRARIGVIVAAVVALAIGSIVIGPSVDADAHGDASLLSPQAAVLPNGARAQFRLLAGVDATRAYFLDHGTFEELALTDLERHEPAIGWRDATDDAGPSEVSVDVTSDARITLASRVERGVCAFARDVPTEARTETTLQRMSSCRAEDAPRLGWSRVDGGF